MDETLIGAIIGGIISGGAGLIVAWFSSRLKDKEWMKLNVYPRLYDWFSTRLKDFQSIDELVYANDSKSKLTSSEYLKLDKKIKEKFDVFIAEGHKWDTMLGPSKIRFERKDNGIFNTFIQPLKDSGIITSNEYILDKVNSVSFLQQFFIVFIDPSIQTAEILYQRMQEYAEKKNISEIKYLEEIKKERPEFFKLINEKLPNLRNVVLSDVEYSDLMKQGEKTKRVLSDLIVSLGNKIKK